MLHPWLSSDAWNTLITEGCTERPDLTAWIVKLIDNNKLTCDILRKSAPSFVDIKDTSKNRKLELRIASNCVNNDTLNFSSLMN
uniref:Uncharacterized protein n=1 Tax=Romanomermis culicivorax TaxID=13658 RepID=A0A915K6P4_ROMCU